MNQSPNQNVPPLTNNPLLRQPSLTPPTPGVGQRQMGVPGGFWIRFVALIIDSIVVTIATLPIKFVVNYALMGSFALKPTAQNPGGLVLTTIVGLVISFAAYYFYFGYFYSTRGASPGKALMGLKVLNHGTGTYLTYGQAFLRETLGKFCSGIILGIGYFMVGFRADKRALHDLIANTEVVKQS